MMLHAESLRFNHPRNRKGDFHRALPLPGDRPPPRGRGSCIRGAVFALRNLPASSSRRWGRAAACFTFFSTLDGDREHNDPTVERCERRARALGYGGFAVTNFLPLCATRPEDLETGWRLVGPGNDEAILDGGGRGRTADLRLGRSRLPPRAGRCGRDAAARGRA